MKVLLIANIGRGSAGFYHVGDEAMFYQTCVDYAHSDPHIQLETFSSSISHQHLHVKEHPLLDWPQSPAVARYYCLKLCLKVLLYRLSGLSLFSPEQHACISTIESSDRLHWCGGGNITSEFGSWLYFSLFLMVTGWIFGKEVVLSSQTIGPFSLIDRVVSAIVLNLPKSIGVRERIHHHLALLPLGVLLPHVFGEPDAATNLSTQTTYHLPPKTASLRVGISIHPWKEYADPIAEKTLQLLQWFHQRHSLEVVLIPHVFDENMQDWDMAFLHTIVQQLPPDIRVIEPNYRELMHSSIEPACTIKALSAEVNVLITSRYHGLVFALSTATPVVGFVLDPYYNRKNQKLLEFYSNASNYCRLLPLSSHV